MHSRGYEKVRSNFQRQRSIFVADDYKWHKAEMFEQGLRNENCTLVLVDGLMTSLCNPGDRFIHKIAKAEARLLYEAWALQQPEVNGNLPCPSRSLTANWFHQAWGKITPCMVARSFVACRVLRVEDYSEEEQRRYLEPHVRTPHHTHTPHTPQHACTPGTSCGTSSTSPSCAR